MIDLINKIVSHLCYRCDEDEYMRGIKHDCNTCLLSEVMDEIKSINDKPHSNTKVKGDVIYRCDALEEMAQSECGCHYETCIKDECECPHIGRIKDIPSATHQTEQEMTLNIDKPHGEWIRHEVEDTCRWVECSECHKEYPNIEMNFCPNCGKRMRGNEKNEENNNMHKVPLYVYASWDRSEE